MSSSMRDLIDDRAELDDEEDDESFAGDEEGEEAPRRRQRNPDLDDSSEEDEDDDDEEEARKIREGFIVDEDEEDDEDSETRERRRRKKRRRAEREQEEVLDDEDLDLIGEANPDFERREQTQSQFKRLKRGHGDEGRQRKRGGLDDMFSEDDEEAADDRHYARPSHTRAAADEFDDFIEEDYDDEDERLRQQEDMEVARGRDRLAVGSVIDATGLDKETLEDMEAIFGNGEDYEWALYKEEDEDAGKEEQPLELKDVFEPSQLSEKLLTEADNDIRVTDEPERFQLDRRPFKKSQVTPDLKEETKWIANQMWEARKFAMESSLEGPFSKAVNKVLEFFVVDYVEVPYVFQHRKDYLIHARKMRNPHYDRRDLDSNESEYEVKAEKLLNQDDLWRIVELDIKFRGFIEKRSAVEKLATTLRSLDIEDQMLEELIPQAREMDELQDLLDYTNFKYAAQLKDAGTDGAAKEVKRPGARSAIFDRVRRSKAYDFFQAYGMSPEQVVTNRINAQSNVQRIVADDPSDYPIDLADSLVDGEFLTGDTVISAARQLYAEELFTSPRLRKAMRATYFMTCVVDCRRTEKGMRKIEESHPYYEVKYLRNQSLADLAQRPEIFLKMLKAEEEGLLEVRISLRDVSRFRKQFFADFASDNYSNKADAWNEERSKVLELALSKLDKAMVKAVKDAMRTQCQESILKLCREEFSKKLDQAPYKPKGMVLGTAARVLAFSNGMADPGREKISYAWVEEDGRVIESGQLGNLARDEDAREQFTDLVNRRQPDVIAVSGFCSDSNKLVKDLENLVSEKGIMGPSYDDPETSELRTDLLEVLVVNDEVARLYKDSPRGKTEHPTLAPLVRYCVALAKYLQDPLKEYAALGRDIVSLLFHPCQSLLPEDKLRKYLETAMVDLVNLCGVDINEAVSNPYVANLLPYVSGLGPRKAQAVIKGINLNGGSVIRRDELVGDPDNNKLPVVGVKVWDNCASFLYIEYDSTNPQTEPLDNTRVHPEDYELGRKMAADALELDEEDVKAETDENGPGAVVRKLFRDDEQDKVNELVLEEYAEQLEQQYSQRKRATLETIRAELQAPYEELRRPFMPLNPDEVFTMFTGETRESLAEHMIIPVNVRVVKDDFAIVRLDCGIEGRIEAEDVSYRSSSVKDVLSVGQTVQAKVLHVDRKGFTTKLSVREDALRVPYKKRLDYDDRNWDYDLERHDKEDLKEKDSTTGRTQRVINHPLFKPFNSTQAEEYLGSQASGEVIIRPSSKGNDHLAITWKVADGVYQHVDVLELQKENEFSVGRLLRVGKFNYTDLDELIVEHVKAMARKVAEMIQHEKFHNCSRNELERWLTTYMDANPNRSSYAFCIDNKHAGYFWLCFKANRTSRVLGWPVRVVPNGYEFLKAQYPDMKALTNGFKIRYQAEISRMQNVNGR